MNTLNKKKVVLTLTDWQANVLDYIQNTTDMTYTEIPSGSGNLFEKRISSNVMLMGTPEYRPLIFTSQSRIIFVLPDIPSLVSFTTDTNKRFRNILFRFAPRFLLVKALSFPNISHAF